MITLIINQNNKNTPDHSEPLPHQKNWLLNGLIALGYTANHMPIGDLLRLYHQLPPGNYLVAQPIYWQATHNDVLIRGVGDSLALSEEEAQRCFTLAANFLSTRAMELLYHCKDLWLVRLHDQPLPHAPPPINMVNHSLMPYLVELDTSLYWQKILTEIQMLFANEKETLPINGLWFYGAGIFKSNPAQTIFTDDERLYTHLSSQFTPLTKLTSIPKNARFMLNNYNNNIKNLSSSIQKHTCCWFWNNKAYKSNKISLWRKLWRTFHANKTKNNC